MLTTLTSGLSVAISPPQRTECQGGSTEYRSFYLITVFVLLLRNHALLFLNSNKSKLDSSRATPHTAGEQIPMTPSATFPGVILDEKLNWKAQMVAVRCQNRLNGMQAITGKSWRASKSCLLQLCRATVRSVIDYESEAFNLSCKQNKMAYDSIQFQALKM